MTLNEQTIYVSYGAGLAAYDTEAQREQWVFRPENAQDLVYAPPSIQENRILFGDFGASGGMFSPNIIVTAYGLEENNTATPNILWTNTELATDKYVAGALQVGDIAYLLSADFHAVAIDATTGAEIWRFPTLGALWSQAVYHEGVLYFTSLDKHIYALDADSGELIWQHELGGAISAQPVVNPDLGLLYIGAYDNHMHALDMETGDEVWVVEATNWIWSAPALDEDVLYYADSNGEVFAVSATDGEPLWIASIDNMRTVEGVLQQVAEEIEGTIQASPVVAGNMVYIASEGNRVTEEGLLVALNKETGAEVWQQTVNEPLYTTPLVVGDTIVVAMAGEGPLLVAFDLETGGQKWVYSPAQ